MLKKKHPSYEASIYITKPTTRIWETYFDPGWKKPYKIAKFDPATEATKFPKNPKKHNTIWMFPKIGVNQNGWFIMENPFEIDDLGVIFGNIHILGFACSMLGTSKSIFSQMVVW